MLIASYKLNKKCPKCGSRLLDKNKSGFCNRHRDRTGKNNPFYGKTHSKETIAIIKEKVAIASTNLWKNPEYRNKVIKGVSKPRKDSFRKEQSDRIKKWYENNPEQKEIRSVCMKNSWATGKIVPNADNISSNKSKAERKFFEKIHDIDCTSMSNCVVKDGDAKWYFPDIFIKNDNIIIEFYGDYWHANPKRYEPDDIVHHNFMAKEIWERDHMRKQKLELMGYIVEIVWENESSERFGELKTLLEALEWDSCALG